MGPYSKKVSASAVQAAKLADSYRKMLGKLVRFGVYRRFWAQGKTMAFADSTTSYLHKRVDIPTSSAIVLCDIFTWSDNAKRLSELPGGPTEWWFQKEQAAIVLKILHCDQVAYVLVSDDEEIKLTLVEE